MYSAAERIHILMGIVQLTNNGILIIKALGEYQVLTGPGASFKKLI